VTDRGERPSRATRDHAQSLAIVIVGPQEAALLVLIVTVAYVLAVSAFLDYGENQRVHVIIDDVLLVLVAAGLQGRALRLPWRRRTGAAARQRPGAD